MRSIQMASLAAIMAVGLTPAYASSAFFVAQRFGHPSIVMSEVSADVAYDTKVVQAVDGFDAQDRPTIVKQEITKDHVDLVPAPDTALIVVQADFGYHARKPNELWHDGRRSQIPGTTIGLHATKESVNILKSAPATLHPHKLKLEIVPLKDPVPMRRGDKLPVQVLYMGKPLIGVQLNEDFLDNRAEKTAPTDANGKTVVTLHGEQFHVVQLTYESKIVGDPDAEVERYNASLTFTLATVDDGS